MIMESLACGTILLGFVYGPKIYILLSYEPVVVEARVTAMQNMSEDKDFNLFEAGKQLEKSINISACLDEELQQRPGAVSPTSSTDSSTRTTRCSSLAHRCTITSSSGTSSCGACSDDQVNTVRIVSPTNLKKILVPDVPHGDAQKEEHSSSSLRT